MFVGDYGDAGEEQRRTGLLKINTNSISLLLTWRALSFSFLLFFQKCLWELFIFCMVLNQVKNRIIQQVVLDLSARQRVLMLHFP